ncbi:MAG: hypothetical protein DBY09_00070, partial [Selenomonadales bacterium]
MPQPKGRGNKKARPGRGAARRPAEGRARRAIKRRRSRPTAAGRAFGSAWPGLCPGQTPPFWGAAY